MRAWSLAGNTKLEGVAHHVRHAYKAAVSKVKAHATGAAHIAHLKASLAAIASEGR